MQEIVISHLLVMYEWNTYGVRWRWSSPKYARSMQLPNEMMILKCKVYTIAVATTTATVMVKRCLMLFNIYFLARSSHGFEFTSQWEKATLYLLIYFELWKQNRHSYTYIKSVASVCDAKWYDMVWYDVMWCDAAI